MNLLISGELCVQQNSAKATGGFAVVGNSATLLFQDPGTANMALNSPNSIAVNTTGNVTAQGSGAWLAGRGYTVTGTVSSCAASFAAGTTTTCDACGADKPWDSTICSCKVSEV